MVHMSPEKAHSNVNPAWGATSVQLVLLIPNLAILDTTVLSNPSLQSSVLMEHTVNLHFFNTLRNVLYARLDLTVRMESFKELAVLGITVTMELHLLWKSLSFALLESTAHRELFTQQYAQLV